MVYGINGSGNVNNDVKIDLKKVETPTARNTGAAFGDGFANTGYTVALTRNIPGLEQLMAKFDFEPPKYSKDIAQLTISDKDYIPDGNFKETALQEA